MVSIAEFDLGWLMQRAQRPIARASSRLHNGMRSRHCGGGVV